METNPAVEELKAALRRSEERWKQLESWPPPVLLMACLRELDTLFVASLFSGFQPNQQDRHVLAGGFEAITRLMRHLPCPEGIPIFKQDEYTKHASHFALLCAADISGINRLLEMERRKLVELELDGPRTIRVHAPARVGAEPQDRATTLEFWGKRHAIYKQAYVKEFGRLNLKKLRKEISENVYSWEQHYIGYTSNDFLDSAFAQVAVPLVYSDPQVGFLPDDTKLGDFDYSDVIGVAVALTAFALKHVHMSLSLIKKDPTKQLVDLLSVGKPLDSLVESVSLFCNFSEEKTRTILDCFMWSPDDQLSDYGRNSARPPIIAFNKDEVVSPYFTLFGDPFSYALRQIRHKHEKSWDKAMNLVEDQFRSELYNLFQGNRFYCVPGSRKVRHEGKLITDVDAIVLDRVSGTLGLYQLKWQMPFWTGSLDERHSRRSNYLKTGSSWSASLAEFLPQVEVDQLYSMFSIPKKTGEIRQVMGFVLGRFFSDFPDYDYGSQDGVTWGSWAQFVKARGQSQWVYDTQTEIALKLFGISTSPPEKQVHEDEMLESIRVTKAVPRQEKAD